MTPSQRVFRHTLIQIMSRFIGTLLGLVAIGIMTRTLGREGFGAYTTVTAYLGVFAVLVDFGISTTLTAMLSEKGAEEEKLRSNAMGLRLATTTALLTLAVAVGFLTPYTSEIKSGIAILSISFLFVALHQVQVAIYQRHLRMDRSALAELAGRATLVALVAAAALSGAGLYGLLLAVVAANALQAALAQTLLGGIARTKLAFDPAIWKKILERAWPVGVSIVFNLIYLRADTLILSLTRPAAEVGVYGAAYRVVDVLTVFPMMFMGIVLPFLSGSWSAGERERFNRILNRALQALALAAAPMIALTVVLGPDLMALVAGREFRESGEILRVLVWGVAAIFVAAAFTHAIVASGAQRRIIPLLAADAAISLALYLLLIPRLGMVAAAWITVLSEVGAMSAAIIVARRQNRMAIFTNAPLSAAAAAAASAVVILPLSSLHVILRLALGAAAYAIFALLFRALTKKDLRELLSLKQMGT